MRKLKIAYYCSNRTVFPPPGGLVTANADVMEKIVRGMIDRGHEVTIYASQGSSLEGAHIVDLDLPPHHLDAAYEEGTWIQDLHISYRLAYMSKMVEDSKNFDLLHLHVGRSVFGMPFAPFSKAPMLFTIHEEFDPHFRPVMETLSGSSFISISDAQRKRMPSLNYVSTIYHGVETKEFPFRKDPKDGFLFMSRVSKEKGVETAIEAAKTTGSPLNIHGPGKEDYLKEAVHPFLDEKIRYHGMTEKHSPEWFTSYAEAKALLMPIQWEEPFGLVMIEAMACGTPVIAFARGSVPEIIEDGKTGFLINPAEEKRGEWTIKESGVAGFCEAIRRMNSMKESEYREMRETCRRQAEERFNTERMVEDYEKIYYDLTN